MRDLLVSVDPSLWSQFSVCIFVTCFVLLTYFVYRPSQKNTYIKYSQLPLDSE